MVVFSGDIIVMHILCMTLCNQLQCLVLCFVLCLMDVISLPMVEACSSFGFMCILYVRLGSIEPHYLEYMCMSMSNIMLMSCKLYILHDHMLLCMELCNWSKWTTVGMFL